MEEDPKNDRGPVSAERSGFRTFITIWLGQLVSLTGSGLTSFSLGVWVYEKTGSATQFALIAMATTFPIVLLSLFSGPLVDRWDRRRTMIVSDCCAAVPTMVVALLLMSGRLEVWHIYVAVALSSSSTAFQWPAYTATITLLVPRRHLARAAGMVEFARAGAMILAPSLAGILMIHLEIWGILLIDFASFLFAVTTLVLVRIPRPPKSVDGPAASSLWSQIRSGWRFLFERGGLVRLQAFFAFLNFSVAMVLGLTTPMLLSFANAATLGMVLSIGAAGMLAGGLVLSLWGGPKLKVHGVLGFGLLLGSGLVLAGLRPSVPLIIAGLVAYNFSVPIINGCSQAIWQSKTPPELQGRIFAIRRMFATFSTPLGYLAAGPLADLVFEPWLADGGALSGSVGRFIGVGPGRGIALIFILQGVLSIAVAALGLLSPRLRKVEEELPDAIVEESESKDRVPATAAPAVPATEPDATRTAAPSPDRSRSRGRPAGDWPRRRSPPG